MTPAELARIRRIVELRAAQLRIAESAHARDAAASERARQEETDALQAVDDAADAASVSGRAGTAIDDLVEARLRVAFLSRLAAERTRSAGVAEATRRASNARLQVSNRTSEQMKTWLDGAHSELRVREERRDDALRDDLAARRAATKEPT